MVLLSYFMRKMWLFLSFLMILGNLFFFQFFDDINYCCWIYEKKKSLVSTTFHQRNTPEQCKSGWFINQKKKSLEKWNSSILCLKQKISITPMFVKYGQSVGLWLSQSCIWQLTCVSNIFWKRNGFPKPCDLNHIHTHQAICTHKQQLYSYTH